VIKTKNNLSGKYFGTLSKEDLRRPGYVSMNEIVSRWRSSMNQPVQNIDRNVGDLVYEAFK
jgi:hypothetical protein